MKARKVIEEMVNEDLKQMQEYVKEILAEKAAAKLEEKKVELAATLIKRD